MVILLRANTIDHELVMYTFVTDLAIYLVTSSFKEKDKEAYWHSKTTEILNKLQKVCSRGRSEA